MRRPTDRTSRIHRFVIMSALSLAPLAACASTGGGHHADTDVSAEAAGYDAAPSNVVVKNNSWDRVTVYLVDGETEWRLGEVEASTQRTLTLNGRGPTLMGHSPHLVGRRLAGSTF